MTSASLYLADSNILLRLQKRQHPQHLIVRQAIDELIRKDIDLAYTLQNMAEFWNVSTRPLDRNGFGMSLEDCASGAEEIEDTFVRLIDTEAVYTEWRRIVVQHRVSGVQVHDARLAASMYAHGLTHILTFNVADFARFKGITAIHPASLSS